MVDPDDEGCARPTAGRTLVSNAAQPQLRAA